MVRGLLRLLSVMALVVSANAMAFAQTSSSITGVVTDTAGGTVPGASVTVTNNATKTALEGVTNSAGAFSFPALPVGTYTVKVTLAGFKTFVANEVRLLGSQPANVPVSLEIGALTEQVEVRAGTELVQTQLDLRHLDADHRAVEPAAAQLAERALRRGAAAGRLGRQQRPARLRHQRSAEQHGQHHDRRRQHRQHAAVDRRVLLDGHAAHGRGRGNHGHGRGPGRRRRRRIGAGRDDDAGRLEQVRRQRLSLLAAARVQFQLLLQQGQQPPKEQRRRAPVRLPSGRPDRHPRPLRRPRQGLLLLQLRAPLPAVERDAHARVPDRPRRERHLRLQRHRRRRAGAA